MHVLLCRGELTDALRQRSRRHGAHPVSVPTASKFQCSLRLLTANLELHGPGTFVLRHRGVFKLQIIRVDQVQGAKK